MANNDAKIELLQKKIEEKRKELEVRKSHVEKFKTNMVLNFDGSSYKLNVMKKDELTFLFLKLHSYKRSLGELSVSIAEINGMTFLLDGYSLYEWLDDIIFKLRTIIIKEEEQKLKQMEKVLESKLSEDRKTELELQEIENLLK